MQIQSSSLCCNISACFWGLQFALAVLPWSLQLGNIFEGGYQVPQLRAPSIVSTTRSRDRDDALRCICLQLGFTEFSFRLSHKTAWTTAAKPVSNYVSEKKVILFFLPFLVLSLYTIKSHKSQSQFLCFCVMHSCWLLCLQLPNSSEPTLQLNWNGVEPHCLLCKRICQNQNG